jgi:hypothetical protein
MKDRCKNTKIPEHYKNIRGLAKKIINQKPAARLPTTMNAPNLQKKYYTTVCKMEIIITFAAIPLNTKNYDTQHHYLRIRRTQIQNRCSFH